jgi:NAD-dependent dihydropyrimidine dehydrogenase PreA subunit
MTDGHPDVIDCREAEEFGREIGRRSQRIYAGETGLIPELPEGKDADPLWRIQPLASSDLNEARIWTKKNMKINMDKCKYPACTVCIDNCPVNSIDFSVSPPVFRSNCLMDFFCESVCPEGAIEADFSRYMVIHDVLVKGLFVRTLNDAEAQGKFRRLVPMERVEWNRHQLEITGHPRIIPE